MSAPKLPAYPAGRLPRDLGPYVYGTTRLGDAKSWLEFCVRFAHGFPLVRASVGATSRPAGLEAFLAASSGRIEPLPADLQAEIVALQARWSDETDVRAEPWSM